MTRIQKKKNRFKLTLIILCLIFSAMIYQALNLKRYFILNNPSIKEEVNSDKFSIYFNQPDLTGPNITFIQPNLNGTEIGSKSYEIIVNITDENPPSPGNVLIQISNFTNLLINTSMTFSGGNSWTYKWENLSTYTNKIFYILRVWAKDSSPNETSSLSELWYVYLNLYTGIDLSALLLIIYIIASSTIISGIIVFFNHIAKRRISAKEQIG